MEEINAPRRDGTADDEVETRDGARQHLLISGVCATKAANRSMRANES